jgi:hypothetical protein
MSPDAENAFGRLATPQMNASPNSGSMIDWLFPEENYVRFSHLADAQRSAAVLLCQGRGVHAKSGKTLASNRFGDVDF